MEEGEKWSTSARRNSGAPSTEQAKTHIVIHRKKSILSCLLVHAYASFFRLNPHDGQNK